MARRLPDPEEVLAGSARASVEQLLALIHAVNPTGRGYSARSAAGHYAVKSRLQSLLVREYGEWLDVTPTGDGVVSLRHRLLHHAGCHAVVVELEDDARRWVETQLALAAPAGGRGRGRAR